MTIQRGSKTFVKSVALAKIRNGHKEDAFLGVTQAAVFQRTHARTAPCSARRISSSVLRVALSTPTALSSRVASRGL